MEFTLRGAQSSLWHPWGVRPHISAPAPAITLGFAYRRLPSFCRARKGDEAGECVLQPSQSWMNTDSPYADTYAGWSFVEPDATDDFLRGVLKIGMAIALGIGISIASYSIYSRKGFAGTKDGLASLPVVLQIQHGLSTSLANSTGHEAPNSTFKQNVENQMDAQASDATDEEVSDFNEPNYSGQVPEYTNEYMDENNKKGLLSVAASTPLSSTNLELKQVSSSNVRDTDLPESLQNGEIKQSERGSMNVYDAGIEQNGNTVVSIDSTKNINVKEFPVTQPNLSSEFSSDVPVYYTSSLNPFEDFSVDVEEANFEIPSFVDIKEDIEIPVIATGLDFEFLSSVAEDSLEEIEQDISLSSPSYTPMQASLETADMRICVDPLVPYSLIERTSNVNASEHSGKVVSSSKLDMHWPPHSSEVWISASCGVPAPSAHYAASKIKPGRVLVPAVVDQLQEQSVAALQNLKVIESNVEPGSICTRRQYARWIMVASRILARSSAHKVFPAMYIENVSEPAFEDVSAEDPDFSFIQGLAEAGLISSRLSEGNKDDRHNMFLFLPDSPLSRQDLVSWKIALEQHRCRSRVDEPLQALSVFIDIDKIHKDALPALALDASAGEQSITAMAFGYTRRFQPDKPVTVAQAAIALTSGEGGEYVAEELARLAAEKLAEEAVATEIALEAHAKKEANVAYLEELEKERKCIAAAESLVAALRLELESLNIERENEKYGILKAQAFVESEKESISHIKAENERVAQELLLEKVKVAFETERLDKLVRNAEQEKQSIMTVRSELEVEKKALILARSWAEDEAKQARAHAKILEEARKRWEVQGIEVHVDPELDENNIPSPVWTYHQNEILSKDDLQRPTKPNLAARVEDVRRKCKQILDKLLEVSEDKFSTTLQQTVEALQEIWKKIVEIQQVAYSSAIAKTSELQKAAASAVNEFSSHVVGGTKKLADGCKDGAEKLVERFKT